MFDITLKEGEPRDAASLGLMDAGSGGFTFMFE
jgi:hypothetical protein